MGLVDILIVNVFIVKHQVEPALTQHRVRYDLVAGLVCKADDLDERAVTPDPESTQRHSGSQQGPGVRDHINRSSDSSAEVVTQFQGVDKHHHDRLCEYVTREQAVINERIVKANPSICELNRQQRTT